MEDNVLDFESYSGLWEKMFPIETELFSSGTGCRVYKGKVTSLFLSLFNNVFSPAHVTWHIWDDYES
jgi:hypothetical protein